MWPAPPASCSSAAGSRTALSRSGLERGAPSGSREGPADQNRRCPRALRRPQGDGAAQRPAANQGSDDPLLLDGQALTRRIEAMDAQRIDIAVLSINPNWYDINRDLATQIISV